MKIKSLVAAAATVVASSAMAQSAFEGFYGQIATGYESNQVSNLNMSNNQAANANTSAYSETYSAANQNFGGAPLVIGVGYNARVAPSWLLGLGVDYSAISQTSSTYSTAGSSTLSKNTTTNGSQIQVSNRFNIFVTPGYEIDKDKLVYLKAGYSSVSAKSTFPTSATWNGSTVNQSFPTQTKTLSGYVLGLGYKQIISDGLYGFAEGNYMGYSSTTFSSTNTTGYTATVNPSVSSYQLLVGLGYKF